MSIIDTFSRNKYFLNFHLINWQGTDSLLNARSTNGFINPDDLVQSELEDRRRKQAIVFQWRASVDQNEPLWIGTLADRGKYRYNKQQYSEAVYKVWIFLPGNNAFYVDENSFFSYLDFIFGNIPLQCI